jgi:beta-lactamase regulating signal transducer with metallopeptidase domain
VITLEQILSTEGLHHWGLTLLHSLWQLALIGCLLAFVLQAASRCTANVRYLVACLGLASMFLTPIATYLIILRAAGPETAAYHPLRNDDASARPALMPPPSSQATNVARTAGPRFVPGGESSAQVPDEVLPPATTSASKPIRILDRATGLLAPCAAWMTLFWAAGVVALSVRHLGGYAVIRRMSRRGIVPVPERLERRFRELKARLKVAQPVRFRQSILVDVPVVIGCLRPMILAPAAALAGLSPQALDAVIAHELAHVRRGDYLVNLLQTIVETLLFYHPAVWWISKRIRIERENCCDDVAVAACGSRIEYAEALTSLEAARRVPQLSLAATGRSGAGETLSRIRRILGVSGPERGRASPWLGGAVALALLALLAVAGRLGYAQDGRPRNVEPPQGASPAQPDVAPAAKPDDQPWGKAIEGMSLRLRAQRTRWSVGESPRFTLDVRNQGRRSFRVFQSPVAGTFLVDGYSFAWSLGWVGGASSPLPPGQTYEGIQASFGEGWVPMIRPGQTYEGIPAPADKSWPGKHFREGRLTPGKYTIRYVATLEGASTGGKKIKLPVAPDNPTVVTCVSNPMEVEIVASMAPSAAEAWGNPVDGVSVTLRADHFAWTADDQPTFAAGVRNSGQRSWFVSKGQGLGELEVDGVWYRWWGKIRMPRAEFPPGRQYDNIRVTLDSVWRTKEGQPFHLGGGRHIVRFAMSIEPPVGAAKPTALRAVSNPAEINVDPGIAEAVALVKKYLPGSALRKVRKGAAPAESFAEILTTSSGQEVGLGSLRQAWANVNDRSDGYLHNPKLTALLPSLKVKIATAEEAQDVARMVYELFFWEGVAEWSFKAQRRENGWLVTPTYVGPPAGVGAHYPVELITSDGMLRDVQIDRPGFRGPAPPKAAPAAPAARPAGRQQMLKLPVRVVDADGKPVVSARIIPWALRSSLGHGLWEDNDNGAGVGPKEVVTGVDGTAIVLYPRYLDVQEQIRTLAVSLFVDHPAFAFVDGLHVDVPRKAKGPYEVILTRGVPVEIRPLIDGKAISLDGVFLLWSDGRSWRKGSAPQKTAGGALRIPAMPPGKNSVLAVRLDGERATHFSKILDFELAAGEPKKIEVPLRQSLRIQGVLTDNVPRPVRQGRIKTWTLPPPPTGLDYHRAGWFSWTAIRPDGTFTIDGWPAEERVQLIALCDGYIVTSGLAPDFLQHPPDPKEAKVDPYNRPQVFEPRKNGRITVAMSPLVRCVATAVDEHDKPVAGVNVVSWPNVGWWNWGSQIYCDPLVRGERLLREREYDKAIDKTFPAPFEATTDAQGKATLQLPEGNECLAVGSKVYELPVLLGSREVRVKLVWGETTEATLRLQPRGAEKLGE